MDERSLKYFEVVARVRGIRAASEILHVAPSAISRKIAELERQFAVKLLDRVGRKGVVVTAAGNLLLQYIKDLRIREDDLLAHMSDVTGLRSGTLRIVSGGGFVSDLIANAVASFTVKYPGFRFILNVRSGDAVLRMIRNDDADLGLLISYPQSAPQVRMPRVDVLQSQDFQPLSVVVNAKSPLAKVNAVEFPQLQKVPLVLLDESFTISHLIRTFEAQHSIRLKPLLECDSFEAVTAFLTAGLGAAIVPEYCVDSELKRKTLTAIPLENVERNSLAVDLIVNSERDRSGAIVAFSEHVQKKLLAYNKKPEKK